MSELKMCETLTVEILDFDKPIVADLDFAGEFVSSSDGEDYKRGYEEGHAQGLADGQAEGYTNGYNEGHSVGYNSGYTQGKEDGLTEGYTSGYDQGKSDGYKAGYDEGYSKGYSDGYSQGLKDGKQEEQEKSVTITENGTSEILPDENKVLSKVTVDVDVKAEPDPELVKQAELLYTSTGVQFGRNIMTEIELDCTNKNTAANMFYECRNLTKVKLTNTGNIANWNYCFYIANALTKLTSIEELDFSGTTTLNSNAFSGCGKVTHFRIVPNTLKCSAPFGSFAKLDEDSIQSVVDGYADMTGQTAPVLTVHPDVKAKIIADDAKEDTNTTKRYWLRTLTSKNVTLA